MYHKSTDFWCIGAGKQGFECKKTVRKGQILEVFTYF